MEQVYRFKFSNNTLEELVKFGDTHRYDEPEMFKVEWDKWVKDNNEMISRENEYLKTKGYKGDIVNKMYKSVRYYFKNKSLEKKEVKKRKKYSSLSKDLLKNIDNFIDSEGIKTKPSDSYEKFIKLEKYQSDIKIEKTRLDNMNDDEFYKKLKKTYKNRYFIRQKKSEFKIIFIES